METPVFCLALTNDLMTSSPLEWGELDYIALRIQREPLDQTNLSNGLDAS